MKKYQNESWLREKVELQNFKQKDIAEMFDVSVTTISYFMKKYGIERVSNTRKKSNLERAKVLHDKQWLKTEYIDKNKSYDTIAKEFDLGKTTVARWVKRHGLDKLKCTTQSGKRFGEGPPVKTECAECGKGITVKYCRYIANPDRFCSSLCSSIFASKNTDVLEKMNVGLTEWRETPEAKVFMREQGARTASEMSAKETSIERRMRELLTYNDIRLETQKKMYYWCVDFYLPDYDIVIEAYGDYWHAHPDEYLEPNAMQRKNIRRDKGKEAYMKKCGHTFMAFWERDINGDIDSILFEILAEINEKEAIA